MRKKTRSKSIFRIFAILFIFIALLLTLIQYIRYQQSDFVFPAGSEIGGIRVGGLSDDQAENRIESVYLSPIALMIDDQTILMNPSEAGFLLDIPATLSTVHQAVGDTKSFKGFWSDLFDKNAPDAVKIDLSASYSADQLQDYLMTEIANRYDTPPIQPLPIAGTTQFSSGQDGRIIDISWAEKEIEAALFSMDQRKVELEYVSVSAGMPSIDNIEILLKQIISDSGYDGLVEIYFQDLSRDRTFHFADQNGTDLEPDIAFTAASTIKIPIMVSALARMDEPYSENTLSLFEKMIVLSDNDATDQIMNQIDPLRGPLEVTSDLQMLGMENTFIAGYFYYGAPLLEQIATPSNQRRDINLSPDVYNQTTPGEIGKMLTALYQCANDHTGLLVDRFSGAITPSECQTEIDLLKQNNIGLLIQSALPEGTTVAHKHGWIEETDGLLHTMSDVGIVYSPGGDYVISIFVYKSNQLVFRPVNWMISKLSQAVYNSMNIHDQAAWIYDDFQYAY